MDYPRDYALSNLEMNLCTAFVIMPIKESFDISLGVIYEVCNSLGIQAKRADDISGQDIIMSNILEGIAKSEFIIVDISENNPNVFYELGIAHTLRTRNSVIIISKEEDISKSTPFDIRHWSILHYNENNIPRFKSKLKEKISQCRRAIDVKDYISHLLRNYTFEESVVKEFYRIANQMNSSNLELICNILCHNISTINCNRDSIIDLNIYLTTLGDYKNGCFQRISWLLKFLVFTSDFVLSQYIDTIKTKFLQEWRRDSINMDDADYWDFVASLCCKIIEKKHVEKSAAISWLIKYLSNARMGRIDKVRTKIEDFLINIDDEEVDNTLVNVLREKNRTVKESAVDICGQKPIYKAIDNLLNILQTETDPHLIRSCINALTRMEVKIAGPLIYNWMENNRDKWGEQAVSASLMHVAENALQRLDINSYNRLIKMK